MASILLDGVAVEAPAALAAQFASLAPAAPPVPSEVTNWQARSTLRKTFLPDAPDTSLFTRTDSMLRAARDEAAALPESDPARVAADLAWQAWEQANTFQRDGALLAHLAARFGLPDAAVDDLFRAASAERV